MVSNDEAGRGPGRPARRGQAKDDDEPALPTRSRDEEDTGWGDDPAQRDDEWYRRERPPHHE